LSSQIGDVEKQTYNYKLHVESLDGIKFRETAALSMNSKDTSILIQTDKGMYKPSDRIQFRVIVVDSETKPVNLKNQTIELYIMDPKHKKIQQWQDVKTQNGVFKGDMKLSKEPTKGKWTLYFSHGTGFNKVIQTKSFEVAEYVPPKFEIITSLPVYNTIEDDEVIFGVEAKTTYGTPVKGTVTVKFDNPIYNSWTKWNSRGRPRPEEYVYKVLPIDGKATVKLNHKELGIGGSKHTRKQTFELTVLEELTGISLKKPINVPIYARDYRISHVINSQNFKPGLAYSFYVKVTRPDGKPMIDEENPVNVAVYYGFDDRKKTDLSFKLDNHGMALISVTAPLSALLLDFIINYREADPPNLYLPRAVSESDNFIQATILTQP
jgi:CD109 antigen